jgi:hypothetical protein
MYPKESASGAGFYLITTPLIANALHFALLLAQFRGICKHVTANEN